MLQIHLSDFCYEDSLADTICFLDMIMNHLDQDIICLGLGENAYLSNKKIFLDEFYERFPKHKVVFLCRFLVDEIEDKAWNDIRFYENYVCRVDCNLREPYFLIRRYLPHIQVETDITGVNNLLRLLEDGDYPDRITLKSAYPLKGHKTIKNSYEAVKYSRKSWELPLRVPESALTPEQWDEYLQDQDCDGYHPPTHWRTYIRGFERPYYDNVFPFEYLKYVFVHSANSQEYINQIVNGILNVKYPEKCELFCRQRREILKDFLPPCIPKYLEKLKNLKQVKNQPTEGLKYLTDNTIEEHHAAIEFLQGAVNVPAILPQIYSALSEWLAPYDFGNKKINAYFQRYKKIKLCNLDDENFKNLVKVFAKKKLYQKFETRRAILEQIKKPAKLYWLDALGVEYLNYIKVCAAKLNLYFEIKVAHAELPTLTSFNKNFYENWQWDKFEKNSALDELKHSQETFDAAGKCSAPTYICEELKIIEGVLSEIKTALQEQETDRVILTSDHGSSRLAVMYGHEIKYEMHTAGEHAGRCCPVNDIDKKPSKAIEENSYWVSTNYDRFKGGRLSNVEVHGGATLEELLVPVIVFSLNENDVINAEGNTKDSVNAEENTKNGVVGRITKDGIILENTKNSFI